MRGAGSAVACTARLAGLRVQFLAQEDDLRWGPPHGLVESSGVLPHIRKKTAQPRFKNVVAELKIIEF